MDKPFLRPVVLLKIALDDWLSPTQSVYVRSQTWNISWHHSTMTGGLLWQLRRIDAACLLDLSSANPPIEG